MFPFAIPDANVFAQSQASSHSYYVATVEHNRIIVFADTR